MNNLTVFEQNGQLLTDSREVAMMVQMNHSDLIRKIKGYMKHLNESNFALVDFFIESTYTDSKGEVRPCYLCTKKGCDMIANKMTGKKGVIFTATYIEAFEKMKDFIEKGTQYVGIPLKEQVESLEVVASMLRMNDASKSLTEKGLKYGENAVSPHNQKEVQPLYYSDTFNELFEVATDSLA